MGDATKFLIAIVALALLDVLTILAAILEWVW